MRAEFLQIANVGDGTAVGTNWPSHSCLVRTD